MKLEAIITALKQAVAMYEVLSMKNKPGKKGKERLADFQKILNRIETRAVEPEEAIAWVYDFCEQHGNKPRLVHCLLIELSKLFNLPLTLGDTFQEEIQKISAGLLPQDETLIAASIIQAHQSKLDEMVNLCKLRLGANLRKNRSIVKLRALH